jgi:hypothetical protein
MLDNRLSDPGDELCDEDKGKYGDNEGHGGQPRVYVVCM